MELVNVMKAHLEMIRINSVRPVMIPVKHVVEKKKMIV